MNQWNHSDGDVIYCEQNRWSAEKSNSVLKLYHQTNHKWAQTTSLLIPPPPPLPALLGHIRCIRLSAAQWKQNKHTSQLT